MIRSIHFQNFKVLRDATLPLGPFTLIVGPNGSGKSTAMQALRFASGPSAKEYEVDKIVTAGWEQKPSVEISINWSWRGKETTTISARELGSDRAFGPIVQGPGLYDDFLRKVLEGFRIYSFDAAAIAAPVQTQASPQLGEDGSGLAAVLEVLRDNEPERFEALNHEFGRWLPEFDRITFEIPATGFKAFRLRARGKRHHYRATDLSQGTLFAVTILTLAYLPQPPLIVCFEEPDRGIHPRLLNEIRDAMYRLAYPKSFGENREPVQVIATTHSPYLLDLYKEHPEEIVIAHKDEQSAHFERLSEKPHLSEILEGAPLGDIWYSGVLGGVPSSP